MYKLKEPSDSVAALKNEGFALDGVLPTKESDDHVYGDIEVEDFNKLFKNDDFIRK